MTNTATPERNDSATRATRATHGRAPALRPKGYWLWFPTRCAVYMRDGWKCIACGGGELDYTAHPRRKWLSVDHVIPRSLGGSNHPSNLICLCISCNSERRHRPFSEWRPDLVKIVRRHTRRKLNRKAARAIALELRPARILHMRRNAAKRRVQLRMGISPHDVEGVPF